MQSFRNQSVPQADIESQRARAKKVLTILRDALSIRDEDFAASLIAKESGDPFRVLVVTILSQNCTDKASVRAYRDLDKQVGIRVETLASARTRTVARAIRVAGLYKQKAKSIREIAQMLANSKHRALSVDLAGPVDEARISFQELPNVGPKTADVLLSVWGRPTISVDTHVDRVSKRLGFTSPKARYEEVRSSLMRIFPEEDYTSVPVAFMAHGRQYCRALRPLCGICPIVSLCPYPNKSRTITTRSAMRSR